jgi:hypothetical protein
MVNAKRRVPKKIKAKAVREVPQVAVLQQKLVISVSDVPAFEKMLDIAGAGTTPPAVAGLIAELRKQL